MVYATRGNRVIQIEEYNIPKYVEQGYNIINNNGAVLQGAVPTDVQVLKKSYSQHIKEIEGLKAEIASLKAELENAKKAVASKPKSEPKVEKVEVVEEAKPVVESKDAIAKAEEALNRPRKSRAKSKE